MSDSEEDDYQDIVRADQPNKTEEIQDDSFMSSSASNSFILNTSFKSVNSKGSTPKIPNKLERKKFDFIIKRSVFRYLCNFFRD